MARALVTLEGEAFTAMLPALVTAPPGLFHAVLVVALGDAALTWQLGVLVAVSQQRVLDC